MLVLVLVQVLVRVQVQLQVLLHSPHPVTTLAERHCDLVPISTAQDVVQSVGAMAVALVSLLLLLRLPVLLLRLVALLLRLLVLLHLLLGSRFQRPPRRALEALPHLRGH